MKIAYFDCFSGISGDMTLGALIHLGVPETWLKTQLAKLPISGYSIGSQLTESSSIQAVRVDVRVEKEQPHRHYGQVVDEIEKSELPDPIKKNSLKIFDRIAEAEAKIHGCAKKEVHFHEVGAVDAIVDIVGACLAVDYLGIESVCASPLALGSGFVECQHGVLPVPAPATVEILKNVPVYGGNQKCELVTPTGAAIISFFADNFGPLPPMRVAGVGYGAGSHQLEKQPNLLRIVIGESNEPKEISDDQALVVVESNIDDMNPEFYGYLMDRLFDDGALDVWLAPIYMKKNRPGTMIQALCRVADQRGIVQRILSETTTLGVRFYPIQREVLERRDIRIDTDFGRITAKKIVETNGRERIVPEFEVCKAIAIEHGLPLKDVYEIVRKGRSVESDDH
jgi:uncharacterized protein (TIGR00299 family) protein